MSDGRFVKGQSGNPSGRPKADVNIRDLARTMTGRAFEELERIAFEGGKDTDRLKALEMILERGWGKAPQPLDGDGQGGPLTVILRRYSGA